MDAKERTIKTPLDAVPLPYKNPTINANNKLATKALHLIKSIIFFIILLFKL